MKTTLLPSERLGGPPTCPDVDLRLGQIKAATLKQKLPHWHFEPIGTRGIVACFPPTHPSPDTWLELQAHAYISAVCGPLYLVTTLK